MATWIGRGLAGAVRAARELLHGRSDTTRRDRGQKVREPDPLRAPGCDPSSLRRCAERRPGSFAHAWTRLFDSRADTAILAELTGRPGAGLAEVLSGLFPEVEGRRLVDEAVTYEGPLVFRFRELPDHEIPQPIDWSADHFGHRGGRLWLQNLSWVDRLYASDGDTSAAAYVVVDWAERVLFEDPPFDFTWDDHALAARPARVRRFLDRYVEQREVLNLRVVHAVAKILVTHVYALATDDCYTVRHNHGMMQDLALLRTLNRLPALEDRQKMMERAERRLMEHQVQPVISSEGIHKENSPHYHVLFLKQLSQALADIYAPAGRPPPPGLLAVRDALLEALVHQLRPDHGLPQFGDTPAWDRRRELYKVLREARRSFPTDPKIEGELQFVLSEGARGRPPEGRHRVFYEGGYAAFRERWGGENPRAAVTGHFKCARLSSIHRHRDDTTISIYGHGQPIVVDSGKYRSDKGKSSLGAYQYTAAAHNVLTVDGRDFRDHKGPGVSRIVASGDQDGVVWVQGRHPYCRPFGVSSVVRTFAYVEPDLFLVCDSVRSDGEAHLLEQHFHLHPSLTETSFPRPGAVVVRSADKVRPAVAFVSAAVPDELRTVRGDEHLPDRSWYFPRDNEHEPSTDVIFGFRREGSEEHLPVFVVVLGPDRPTQLPFFESAGRVADEIVLEWRRGTERYRTGFPTSGLHRSNR